MQHIICTEKSVVDIEIKANGFIKTEKDIFDVSKIWVGPRETLETNEDFKQIIPYVILSYQGKIALYQRTKKGGEDRLHNMHSIGFGGHIDAFDLAYQDNGVINLDKTIENSAQREIDEELNVSEIVSKQHLGYIYDDSNPVGRVHIGVVELWELATNEITSNEDEIHVVGLFTIEELKGFEGEMENWSEHIVNGL
ncbi:MAG: NUDIX domain-containing protein [Xanthomonadales bacterium]|jgi:predicted NUDIX family phosphoesterase|nr:NUDIX domain-containing protein [Xanthomonadales bacterium]MCB1603464.1 NUDIX domain-containing protein [Xanthomonadales bacterium]